MGKRDKKELVKGRKSMQRERNEERYVGKEKEMKDIKYEEREKCSPKGIENGLMGGISLPSDLPFHPPFLSIHFIPFHSSTTRRLSG